MTAERVEYAVFGAVLAWIGKRALVLYASGVMAKRL